jgi:hypothetical protein
MNDLKKMWSLKLTKPMVKTHKKVWDIMVRDCRIGNEKSTSARLRCRSPTHGYTDGT